MRNSLNTTQEARSHRNGNNNQQSLLIQNEFSLKGGSAQFKAVSRERRERILSNNTGANELKPEVGKYTPKYNVILG